jgi:hypothetical protein
MCQSAANQASALGSESHPVVTQAKSAEIAETCAVGRFMDYGAAFSGGS